MTFGAKLKELRQAAGLTQAQLAEASGVPVGTIRDYEQNQREPLLGTAQKLAGALGKSLDVFTPAGPPKGKPAEGLGPKPGPAKKERRRKAE